jgi:predicted nucleotidyltransferase
MSGGAVLEKLARALTDVPGVVSAYVFGSVATGREHRHSDIDVGVLLDRRVLPRAADRFDARLRLAGALTGVARRDVDVVILNDAPPQLVRRIMTEGRRLVVTDAAADRAHLRTMLSRAADLEPFLRRTRAIKLDALSR